MSDLRPKGVEVEIGGKKRNFLFTINVIDEIQEKCNLPLFDAVRYAAKAADGDMKHETLVQYRIIVTALLGEDDDPPTEKEVGKMLTLENYRDIALKVLQAYGISVPDPDGDDDMDDDEEDEPPNVETGQ